MSKISKDSEGLQKLLQDLSNTDKALEEEKKKAVDKVISLIGSTKAGKTTSLLYLAGYKLITVQDNDTGVEKLEVAENED